MTLTSRDGNNNKNHNIVFQVVIKAVKKIPAGKKEWEFMEQMDQSYAGQGMF